MSKFVTLRSFDHFSQVALLELGSGKMDMKVDLVGPDLQDDQGRFKNFWVGGVVSIFQLQMTWFIQIGECRWTLGERDLYLNRTVIGPIGMFTVRSGNFKRMFIESRVGAMFSRIVDPTYDHIDSWADDFPGWAVDLHRKQQEICPLRL